MKTKYSAALLAITFFTAGIFFTTIGASFLGRGDLAGTPSDAAVNTPTPVADYTSSQLQAKSTFSDPFIFVAETVNPTVVQIHSDRLVQVRNPFQGSPFEEFFQQPDGNQAPQLSTALGSGVIIRENGYIVTNNHVVAEAEELTVTLLDGTELDAEVVGTDPASDLAVIRVRQDGLPFLSVDKAATVRVGEWVMAFGSPLSDDLGNTVTSGIVSAVRRTSQRLSTLNLYASFIQTDAAINPGNSGGPLVNLDGQFVGINSAIFSRSGGNQGIGFTIPADVVRNVTTQLIETGSVSRGGLGVRFVGVSRALAEALNVPLGAAQVVETVPNSVAARAGIKDGDIVTSVDGQQLRNSNELRTIVGNRLPGDRLLLSIVRDGKKREIEVVLGDLSAYNDEEQAATPENNESPTDVGPKELGFTISPLSDQIRGELNLGDDVDGVVILTISEGSTAFRDADLRRGDIISSVNGNAIHSPSDFMDAYLKVKSGEKFLIQVVRAGGGLTQKFLSALTKPE